MFIIRNSSYLMAHWMDQWKVRWDHRRPNGQCLIAMKHFLHHRRSNNPQCWWYHIPLHRCYNSHKQCHMFRHRQLHWRIPSNCKSNRLERYHHLKQQPRSKQYLYPIGKQSKNHLSHHSYLSYTQSGLQL